ncbi:unnamed protein product [Echinostoma caproni]|uniref:TPR_REGION domain-containing protein n=1 Tax=Echinostoma caproni TaxID=27848 RepID=A0A183AE96_9TREM|nr:unnamed protein product [Echinostoma caproni]
MKLLIEFLVVVFFPYLFPPTFSVNKLPQSLLVSVEEILAHPAEQVFNTDIMTLTDCSLDSGLGYVCNHRSSASVLPPLPIASLSAPTSGTPQSLILNTRIVGALTDLVSTIYCNLEKSVASIERKGNKQAVSSNISSSAAGTPDQSDGEGSESNYKILIAPGESSSSRLSDDSGATDEQKVAGKQFGNYTPTDPTTGPPSQNDASVVKHRRSSGRWKKHLGDVFLQLGELDKAQQYYDATIQLLRPVMDNLWVAGALEGLCAVAVARKLLRTQFADLFPRSRRPLRPMHLRYTPGERSQPRSIDASGLDLASQKQKPLPQYSAVDYRNMAMEALELYRKNALKPKRLKTLVALYQSMGYKRRAGFVAWHALDQNLKSVNDSNFGCLFQSLRLRIFPAFVDTGGSVDSPGSLIHTDSGIGSQVSPNSPHPLLVMPQSGGALRRPAQPAAVYPMMQQQIMAWYRGISAGGSNASRFSRAAKPTNNSSATNRGASQFRQSKRIHQNDQALMLSDNVRYLPTGWAGLQAAVLGRIIDQFKIDVQFEDILHLSWDKALQFVGFIFSLLDAWPNKLDEARCVMCMEDLCRLAVMRCPDQPTIASSMSCFAAFASGNADRRQWARQTGLLTSTQPNPATIEREATIQPSQSTQLRQLVDLVEVPVYRLPLVQSIHLLPVVPYLIPCELSKEGLASAVPIHRNSVHSCGPPESEISVATVTELKVHSGPFFYAPSAQDPTADPRIVSIDWVCEEPVCVELMVDNQLPVDLRISEVCIELTPLSNREPGGHHCSSVCSPSEYSSLTSGIQQNTIQLEAARLVMEVPSVTRGRISVDRVSMRKRPSCLKPLTQRFFNVPLNEACLLETAEDHIRYPSTNLQSAWRRRNQSQSCTIPANQSGIRLVFTFIPMAEMHTIESSMDDSNTKPMVSIWYLSSHFTVYSTDKAYLYRM